MKKENFGIRNIKKTEIQKNNMEDVFEILNNFPKDIEQSIKITNEIKIKDKYENIVFSGMGGSAISGDIVKDFLSNKSTVPIFVSKEYSLPKFANEKTLLFVISYSGATEETISSLKDGIAKKCKIVAITSNGEIVEICKSNKIDCIKIPIGYQPRFALPYLLFPIFLVIEKNEKHEQSLDNFGISFKNSKNSQKLSRKFMSEQLPNKSNKEKNLLFQNFDLSFSKEIKNCIKFLKKEKENIKFSAKGIAKNLKDKIPLIYSYLPYNSVARRWKNQFNENAKIFSFVNEFPECCHNDIQSWEDKNAKNFVVIILRDENEEERMKKRINATKKLALKNSYKIIEVYAKGKTELARMIYLVYFGDYVSVYLAMRYKRNPLNIEVIKKLKEDLGR